MFAFLDWNVTRHSSFHRVNMSQVSAASSVKSIRSGRTHTSQNIILSRVAIVASVRCGSPQLTECDWVWVCEQSAHPRDWVWLSVSVSVSDLHTPVTECDWVWVWVWVICTPRDWVWMICTLPWLSVTECEWSAHHVTECEQSAHPVTECDWVWV